MSIMDTIFMQNWAREHNLEFRIGLTFILAISNGQLLNPYNKI
ncbi:hypothetical protein L350_07165 [Enterobacter sp. MGH 4]|nr:hypothetical protein L359_05858 [Enterobacter hormaechei subsp. hoffmannii MGH 13]EUM93438.1 hypothetical protein L350_07165 [Enterobacter sp. MGH 4]